MDLGDRNQVLYTLRYREHNNIASKLFVMIMIENFLDYFHNIFKPKIPIFGFLALQNVNVFVHILNFPSFYWILVNFLIKFGNLKHSF